MNRIIIFKSQRIENWISNALWEPHFKDAALSLNPGKFNNSGDILVLAKNDLHYTEEQA